MFLSANGYSSKDELEKIKQTKSTPSLPHKSPIVEENVKYIS